ncbi:amidohydrolase [Paludicola sp. MB14-C6]|uniref:amidohydrolase n=1 Tax=Paludihabitans sp. MB14-C6 TaxID=3070656 RepID=UPI0027DB9499|nr:amidohydrolase [Paludicola sp. MB14-C6]WMJ22954.1 amidohydrolase [Paludicola sp. MB14-C6]
MLIINAKIITMENETIDNGYIVIKDKIIERVGYMEDLNVTSKRYIDAKGGLVLPGFIDPHCHIGMWDDGLGFEGDDGNEETDPITPHLRAIDAVNSFDDCFQEALDAGITTVLTGPGSTNPIAGQWCAMKTRRDRIDNLIVASPVGMKFALGENPKTTYNAKNLSPVTRMATAALIREQLQKTKRYMEDMERWHEDEELDEPEYDMKCEALIPVLKREIKAFFHAHRADDIFTAIRIAEEFNLDYVLVHATEAYKIATQLQTVMPKIITGPIICDRSKPELKGLTPKNAGILRSVGIETAICTDHPVIPIQYLALSAAISAKEGLGTTSALEAITINAAKMAGIDKRVGSIKVGKDADILVFNKNPLDVMASPTHVVVDGMLVKGQFSE